MVIYLARRLLSLIPVLLVVAVVTFLLMYRAPGGPWDRQKPLPAATRRALDVKFGLDKPLWFNIQAFNSERDTGTDNPLVLVRALLNSRFFRYLFGLVRFDLGPSYQSKGARPVQSIIAEKFPTSAKVGLVGFMFAIIAGVPIGIVGALRQNTWLDYGTTFASTVAYAIPSFVTGVLVLLILSAHFGVSPIHRPEDWDGFGRAYLLPGVVLGLGTMAFVARLTRASMLEIKRQDFVRTARAKGLSETATVQRHILRNAMMPVVTVLGPAAAELITGSIIIETIFGVPGLGRDFVTSIAARDYPLIMGTTLFYAALIGIANIIVDGAYAVLDPRVRTR